MNDDWPRQSEEPDREIEAIRAVANALNGLNNAQATRVLNWAANRFVQKVEKPSAIQPPAAAPPEKP